MINTPNHIINVRNTVLDLWSLQISWTTGFRYWYLQSWCDEDESYFSRI